MRSILVNLAYLAFLAAVVWAAELFCTKRWLNNQPEQIFNEAEV